MDSLWGRLKGCMLLPGRLFKGPTPAQLIKYLISGILAAAAEYMSFLILYGVVRLWHIYANSIAMSAGFIVSFILNRKWSFRSQGNIFRQFFLFLLLFFINLGISNAAMYLLSDILAVPPAVSKILVIGLIAAWNFIIYKKIIFRK